MSIQVSCLNYSYPRADEWVLRDISFALHPGEILGLTGPSGAGKSTLLHLMAGLLQTQYGQISFTQAGEPRTALVVQQVEKQFFERTLYADIAFGPLNQGRSAAQARDIVEEAMNTVGLDPVVYGPRSPFTLSSGEKRRAALAGILALEPDYLLCDEIMAGLDDAGREQMRLLLRRLAAEGKGILMVSHRMDEILAVCNRLMIMEQGRITISGDTLSVISALEREWGALTPSREVLYRLQALQFPVDPYPCRDPRDAARQIQQLSWQQVFFPPSAANKEMQAARQSAEHAYSPEPVLQTEGAHKQAARREPDQQVSVRSKKKAIALDPRSRMIFTLLLAVLIFQGSSRAELAVLVAIMAFDFYFSRHSLQQLLHGTGGLFALILFTVLLQIFLLPGETLWQWGPVQISRQGLYQSLLLGLKLTLLIIIMQMMITSTTITELLRGLEWFLQPLSRLKLPVEELVLTMTISLRFIPILNREMEAIRTAQVARGAVFDRGPISKRLRMQLSLLVPLLAHTMQRAEQLAVAMDSRAYVPGIPRTHMQPLRLASWDYLYLMLALLLAVLIWSL